MPIKGCSLAWRQRDRVDLGEQCVLLVCGAFFLRLYRHHINVLLFLSCFLQTKQSQSSHKGSFTPLFTSRARDERRRGGARVDRWTTLLLNQASADLWPPKCIRMAVVTATQTLDPSARHDEDSETEAGLPVHLSLTTISIFVLRTFFHWFCYELWTSSGQCPSTPYNLWNQNIWSAHARIHPSHLFISPACGGTSACARTGGCNTAQRWHFRNLLNNSKSDTHKKSSHLKTLPQNEPGYDLQKSIYWEINLFFQVNVFVKNTNPKPYWLFCQTVFPGGPAYTHKSIKDYCLPW